MDANGYLVIGLVIVTLGITTMPASLVAGILVSLVGIAVLAKSIAMNIAAQQDATNDSTASS